MSVDSANLEQCMDGAGLVWTDGTCVPRGVVDISQGAIWAFDVITPAIGAILLVLIIRDCIKVGGLTWSFMIAIASATCWWLETFGDWGQHLLYSPQLNHYILDWPFSAPHNPALMPLTYALYWWAHAWAILRLVQLLQKRWSGLSLGMGIVILSLPVTFIWNLIIEGAATYFGLWTYDPPIGPAIEWARGTYWPLTWPVFLMVGWINLIAWMIGLPEEQDRFNKLEKFMRIDRLAASANPMEGGIGFQAIRLGAWIVFFNVTFALTLNLPLFLMRVGPGFHSPYLP